MTKPRQEILNVLQQYPLSVQEIYRVLKKNDIKIDLASVYRSLELFVKMGIVYVIELGEDKKRYELVDEDNHHHHLVCNHCGRIEDIMIDEKNIFNNIHLSSDFKIDHHHLEFFGLCKKCQ